MYICYFAGSFVVGSCHCGAIRPIADCHTAMTPLCSGGKSSSQWMPIGFGCSNFRVVEACPFALGYSKKKKRSPLVGMASLCTIYVCYSMLLAFTKAPLVFREQGTCCHLPSRRKLG